MPWDRIPEELRMVTLAWARGDLPNPVSRAVEFANPRVSSAFLRNNAGSITVLRAGNWFIANRTSKTWPAGLVQISSVGMSPAVGLSIIFGSIAAAVAVGVYFGLRK